MLVLEYKENHYIGITSRKRRPFSPVSNIHHPPQTNLETTDQIGHCQPVSRGYKSLAPDSWKYILAQTIVDRALLGYCGWGIWNMANKIGSESKNIAFPISKYSIPFKAFSYIIVFVQYVKMFVHIFCVLLCLFLFLQNRQYDYLHYEYITSQFPCTVAVLSISFIVRDILVSCLTSPRIPVTQHLMMSIFDAHVQWKPEESVNVWEKRVNCSLLIHTTVQGIKLLLYNVW